MQNSNVATSMVVMLFGRLIEVILEKAKALPPMVVIVLGMVIEEAALLRQKAPPPILVTVLGNVVFLQPTISVLVALSMIALQLSRLS